MQELRFLAFVAVFRADFYDIRSRRKHDFFGEIPGRVGEDRIVIERDVCRAKDDSIYREQGTRCDGFIFRIRDRNLDSLNDILCLKNRISGDEQEDDSEHDPFEQFAGHAGILRDKQADDKQLFPGTDMVD